METCFTDIKTKETFLRGNLASFLNCNCNKFILKKPHDHLTLKRFRVTLTANGKREIKIEQFSK